MNCWYLSISTYAGLCPDAVHYYGRIRREDGDLKSEVSLELSDGSPGFASKRTLRRAARAWFRKNSADGDILIEGSRACLDPREILAGPLVLMNEGNRIWRKFEQLGGWDRRENEFAVQRICDEWDRILGRKT